MSAQDMQIRRVVSEKGPEGRSLIRHDGVFNDVDVFDEKGDFARALMWRSSLDPSELLKESDTATLAAIPIAQGESMFVILRFPPQETMEPMPLHQHDTLDYLIVLSGEIWLITEDGETALREGDVVIQRAPVHTWENRTSQTCTVAFILNGL